MRPSTSDGRRDGVPWAVFAVILVVLALGALKFILDDAPAPDPHVLQVDTADAEAMHRWGMPTEEDVGFYRLHGQWGYWQDGTMAVFDALPGDEDAWIGFYGEGDGR